MIGRIATLLAVTLPIAAVGWMVVQLVALGSCGMGPNASASCYEAQRPWVFATIAAFGFVELLAFFLIFSRARHRGSNR